jgi:hypothetical protein
MGEAAELQRGRRLQNPATTTSFPFNSLIGKYDLKNEVFKRLYETSRTSILT